MQLEGGSRLSAGRALTAGQGQGKDNWGYGIYSSLIKDRTTGTGATSASFIYLFILHQCPMKFLLKLPLLNNGCSCSFLYVCVASVANGYSSCNSALAHLRMYCCVYALATLIGDHI